MNIEQRYKREQQINRLNREIGFPVDPILNLYLCADAINIILNYLPQVWCEQCQDLKYVLCVNHIYMCNSDQYWCTSRPILYRINGDNLYHLDKDPHMYIENDLDKFLTREFREQNYIDLVTIVYDKNLKFNYLELTYIQEYQEPIFVFKLFYKS